MATNSRTLIFILLLFMVASVACSKDGESSSPTTLSPPSTTSLDHLDSDLARPFDQTYEAFGNPDAATVIVYAQGGPAPELDGEEAQSLLSGLDLDEIYVVVPHQGQTLEPDRFANTEVDFGAAQVVAETTTALIAEVVRTFVEDGRDVRVVGVSYGAFVVQDLLATQGNVAGGYFIQVGRLDMPSEVWESFSQGRFVGFVDGVDIEKFDAEEAGMGGEGSFTDANMARLAASLGQHRFTERLQDVDLENVVYAYGLLDEQVGRLSDAELAFLQTKGVTVLAVEGDHSETIDSTITEGLRLLGLSSSEDRRENDSEVADGYLPADQVEQYIASYESALDQSAITVEGVKYPMSYASVEDSLALYFQGGLAELQLGDDGISSAAINWEGRQWEVQEAPEFAAVFEELGGEGEMLDMSFAAVASDDPTQNISVRVVLNVNLLGMGNSVVEVTAQYATIEGTLGTSTFVQISDVMRDNPEVDTLVMLNVHGSENDEINVHTARLIRDAGWTTWVPSNGDISSGGVDMFVAGVDRIVEPGGFVGVHSWGSGPGEPTGRDFPADDPAHRSQLEYFAEMMGDEAGADFYFYTLDAAPFEQIHRMNSAEMDRYKLITAEAAITLPLSMIGSPVGYLELSEGVYLKLTIESCGLSNGDVRAEVASDELGPISITASGPDGVLSIPALEGISEVDHAVTDVEATEERIAGSVKLELEGVVDLDTSSASFDIPCSVGG